MGIRGSSTCPIILNDCKVPAENLLGEIGKGHVIAFNILNVGRFKLGAMCVGGARVSLENAIGYAKQRKAFGKVIADFGLVREKIANMATLIYVGESLVYRTVGMMDVALNEVDKSGADATKETRKAIEEYAVECSIIKVWGSEMIDYVVDETVQIYGGYGFVEEYPAERAYRDARINRIFEGTNEINRLIITRLPAEAGHERTVAADAGDQEADGRSAVRSVDGRRPRRPAGRRAQTGGQAKKLGLFAAGAATQKYMQAIQDQQEVMGAIADMTIETYAMESAVLRAQKIVEHERRSAAALPIAMTRVYLSQAMEKIEVGGQESDRRRCRRRHAAHATRDPAPPGQARAVQHHRTAPADRAEDDRARESTRWRKSSQPGHRRLRALCALVWSSLSFISSITLWINSFASVRLFITIWISITGLPGQRWLWQ